MSGGAIVHVHVFEDLSGAGEASGFARGFHEDLVAELARFPALVVRTDEGEAGGGYALTGAVRRSGSRLRINARLTDLASGEHLWAKRFDATRDDPFDVQDEIASAVAGALAAQLDGIRLERARRTPPTSLAAYDLWLQGRACLERGTIEADLEARSFFQRALELDPSNARAHAGMSLSYNNDWTCQAWHLWDESLDSAHHHAARAVELGADDALVHGVLGRVHLFRHEFGQADKALDRALTLNPNEADVLATIAYWKFYLGEAEEAVALVERGMELNPRHGDWYHGARCLAYFGLERFEESAAAGARAGAASVDLPAYHAAAAAMLGREEEAHGALRLFLSEWRSKIAFGREPEASEPMRWLVEVNPFRRAADLERFKEGLRRAGLPDASSDLSLGRIASNIRPAEIPAPAGNVFRRDGELWSLAFEGTGAQLIEVKGFHDLARLLGRPAQPVHCLELAGAPAEAGGEDVLDPEAKRAYGDRLAELEHELEEARELGDAARTESAQAELEAVTGELSRALGLAGRPRKLGNPAERARSAATWRIRSAIKKVSVAHPRLGRHLENSVRTGSFCVYEPERETAWQL
jgi:TolB-like protein/tetratricopeptide (TPR) repeat protein